MKSKKTIYVRLLDGTEARAPVDGSFLDDGTFKIESNPFLDKEDETSIWEFLPGDTVTVQTDTTGISATGLVHSQTSNRDVYSLIFQIVRTNGFLDVESLDNKMIRAATALCLGVPFPQKTHPIVMAWCDRYCSVLLASDR
jgi:hypothetical protein